jgi:hypothetical protein
MSHPNSGFQGLFFDYICKDLYSKSNIVRFWMDMSVWRILFNPLCLENQVLWGWSPAICVLIRTKWFQWILTLANQWCTAHIHVLVHLCSITYNLDWVIYKEKKFISHSSRGLRSSRARLCHLVRTVLLHPPHMVEGRKGKKQM